MCILTNAIRVAVSRIAAEVDVVNKLYIMCRAAHCLVLSRGHCKNPQSL